MKVTDFLNEFTEKLATQLNSDHERYGDTWLEKTRADQERRMEIRISHYFDRFVNNKEPVPWLKIAGNAMIAWIRDEHPEFFMDDELEIIVSKGIERLPEEVIMDPDIFPEEDLNKVISVSSDGKDLTVEME